MKKWISVCVLALLSGQIVWSQAASNSTPQSPTSAAPTSAQNDSGDLRQQIEQLKRTVSALEARLDAQEKQAGESSSKTQAEADATVSAADLKDLHERVNQSEKKSALDRLNWSGDFRFQMYGFTSNYPAHFDGMQLQNLVVKSMFYMQTNGGLPPSSVAAIQNNVNAKYADYLNFTNNLKFSDLKAAMAQFPPAMQQQLMGMLMPSTYVPAYSNNNSILYTNRLRLNLDSQVSDNISVTARLSMYKAFGDSTGVQVFDGQPTSLAIDGTTTGVQNSDIVRVERAYFTWNNIGGLPMYLSVGRRPSTDGPPLNFRDDEPRGGTPSGSLINYQFDGMTFGYHIGDKTTLRACYGVGYEAGYGNGQNLVTPADRLHNAQFFGGNFDIYNNEKTFIQATVARAWNVTDGFNGQIVLPVNPVTGDSINAPVIMRYTPSANLGAINLYGANFSQKLRMFEVYGSLNADATRPNGQTTPFGGLMSDPFETPENHSGWMVLVGSRFSLPQNDGKTKLGFEFNHGSKYWFNFAQAEDDLLAPKTSARGDVYEVYWTQRITSRFIFKTDYQRYNNAWSGSGWHVGAPKKLDSTPVLGFPTFNEANVLSMGVTARF
jgi:Protein of unknown function (DUF3373)